MKIRWPGAAVVILAALIPLGPVMLKGEVPSFRDHEDYFVPLRAFTSDALRAGELPHWNPFNAAGEPWMANPQTGVFYPPAWLVAILPFRTGYVAFLVFHLAVLGLGLRRLFLLWSSDAAATLVSATLVVCGPVLSLLDVSNNLASFAWTPWILARALGRDRLPGVGDSVLLALSFLGGEPLIAAVTWVAWTAINLVRLGRKAVPALAWRLFMAVALSAVQLLPFAAILVGSDRATGLAPEIAFRNSMALRDWLATIVSPAGVQPGIGSSQLFLPSMYVSPLVIFLALVSVGVAGKMRPRTGWLLVLFSSALLASGNHFPIIGWIYESLLLTVSRYPVKFALFGVLAIGALCAMGFDRLDRLSVRARFVSAIAAVATTILAHVLHRSDYPAIAMTGLVVGMLWLAGFLALLWFAPKLDGEAKVLLVCVLLPVVLFESIAASRFLLGSSPWPYPKPYAGSLDPRYSVLRLERLDMVHKGAAHVRDRQAWMGGYLNLLVRQHDASTAAPVVDRRYQELHDEALSAPRIDLLDVLSVRYLFTERDLSSFGYRRVAGNGGVSVFERQGAKPMLRADFSPRPAVDVEAAYDLLMASPESGQVDRPTIAVGLQNEYPSQAPGGAQATTLSISFSWNMVRADVEVSHPALLVLGQRMTDDWSVTVDGEERPPVVADALFRGVEVDRGRHEVVWSYRSRSLRAGIFVTVFAMLALALEWRRVRAIHEKMSRSFHSEHA